DRAGQVVEAIGQLGEQFSDPMNPLGASIGLAEFEVGSGETLRELLIRGDEAMYAAKRAGKNGWVVAPSYVSGPDRLAGRPIEISVET
ncbi:unnamed protein product, partial [Laminaria digitata]